MSAPESSPHREKFSCFGSLTLQTSVGSCSFLTPSDVMLADIDSNRSYDKRSLRGESSQMGQLSATSAQQTVRAGCTALAHCLVLAVLVHCTQKPSSALKETQNSAQLSASTLEPMEVKFSFTYPGLNGQMYPIHMTANLAPQSEPNKAVWNSVIVSDGGLLNAQNESKTIKPDSNLMLSSSITDTPDVLTYTSGNPEIGRGLSLKLQRVKINGSLTWKAVALSYFGYLTDIEDSRISPK